MKGGWGVETGGRRRGAGADGSIRKEASSERGKTEVS